MYFIALLKLCQYESGKIANILFIFLFAALSEEAAVMLKLILSLNGCAGVGLLVRNDLACLRQRPFRHRRSEKLVDKNCKESDIDDDGDI